jgi:ATP-binding cassette subfamily F protein uup
VQKTIEFSYFDQNGSDLRPNDRLKDVMAPNGGDYIDVRGKTRHIYGYLKDFMFDPSVVLDKVGTLSGGQKNRLKLAKILANPKTCLILDEPTNDLDMETLDMLEEILINYEGTLLLVSHDRDFLDQTVTKVLAFEGDGKIEECIGGYSDYLKKKSLPIKNDKKKENFNQAKIFERKKESSETKKLTYKLEYELKNLPKQIEDKEAEINNITEKLSDGDFYKSDPDGFVEMTKELKLAKDQLEQYEERWLELEELSQ